MILDVEITIDIQSNKVDDLVFFCNSFLINTDYTLSEGFDNEVQLKCYGQMDCSNELDREIRADSEFQDLEYQFWSEGWDGAEINIA